MKKNIKSLFLKILSLPFEHPWISFFIIVFLFNILGTTDPPEPKLYPATLYIEDNKAIPCIVQIEKIVDRYEERNGRTHSDLWYTIREIHLPYGITKYPESRYDPDCADNKIDPSGWTVYCPIEVDMEHEAISTDWEEVKSTVPYSTGRFCASRQQDILHRSACRYVKNIKEENLIYFPDDRIADIFGYHEYCDVCEPNAYF